MRSSRRRRPLRSRPAPTTPASSAFADDRFRPRNHFTWNPSAPIRRFVKRNDRVCRHVIRAHRGPKRTHRKGTFDFDKVIEHRTFWDERRRSMSFLTRLFNRTAEEEKSNAQPDAPNAEPGEAAEPAVVVTPPPAVASAASAPAPAAPG